MLRVDTLDWSKRTGKPPSCLTWWEELLEEASKVGELTTGRDLGTVLRTLIMLTWHFCVRGYYGGGKQVGEDDSVSFKHYGV